MQDVINNAIKVALKDGYDQVIIKSKEDGSYSFSRKYETCCPEWYGTVVAMVLTYWENGILKTRISYR